MSYRVRKASFCFKSYSAVPVALSFTFVEWVRLLDDVEILIFLSVCRIFWLKKNRP